MQANLCINSAWQHSKCCTLPCRVFGAFTVMGFWKKLSQYKNYAPQRETKTKASRVWSKLLAWEQEYTFCRVCWGLFGHSIVELKVAVYCWTDVLGLLCSWQWNSPFISLLLNSYAPKQSGHIQTACWEQLLTGWTWELFHIKMVVLDQNLCQGLWHQAPRMGGWVLVPPQSIPGASVSCYCRQSSDSSAVKWKCCFCSEFSLSHISRFSTTVGFIYLYPDQELSYLKSMWRLSCLRNKLWLSSAVLLLVWWNKRRLSRPWWNCMTKLGTVSAQ